MRMTPALLKQLINEAQARVDNRDLPVDVRIRSLETVKLCEGRANIEGWTLTRTAKGTWRIKE